MLKVVESFQLIGPTSPQAPNFSLPSTFPNREFFQKEVVTCVTCVKYVTCVTCVTCDMCDIRDMCDTCDNITCVHYHILCVTA